MTVTLSVHDVRDHIRRAGSSGISRPGQSSNVLLGRIFHEVAADLARADPGENVFSLFENLDFQRDVWLSRLVSQTYEKLLGPRLARDQARLHGASEGVLHLWAAIQSLCGWLVDLAWEAMNPTGRKRALSWDDLRMALRAEVPLEVDLRVPGWSESVRLTGIADSLLRLPRTGSWCVQEYKLGRTSPEADLAQVCLYHLILVQTSPQRKRSRGRSRNRALALISFRPEVEERLFSEEEIATVQEKLLDLIGHLAGFFGKRSLPAGGPEWKVPDAMGELGRKVIEVFTEYGRPVETAGGAVAGPAFFRLPILLGRGVKLEQIQRLGREVQVRVGFEKRPIIGVDRGRVVVDIERPDRQTVHFADIEDQLPPAEPVIGSSLVPIGVDLDGRLRTADLNNPVNAHLLVAGTTGSGKTEWLRTAIHGLVCRNTPKTLRLVLMDPKRTAFNEFRDSPFLLTPESLVFPDTQPALDVLKALVAEMERRYHLFSETGVRDLSSFGGSTGRMLPRIVCVCDEYYALVAGDPKRRKEVEVQISLLGAKARAAGIHLILATQQPSREVVKGAL
ncbi:MAG: hypothetical protein JXL84_26705, partial [Deltaproteobacteria bacterium]|nr:hypothetical protein [Deltaproteobacteria bacterium]